MAPGLMGRGVWPWVAGTLALSAGLGGLLLRGAPAWSIGSMDRSDAEVLQDSLRFELGAQRQILRRLRIRDRILPDVLGRLDEGRIVITLDDSVAAAFAADPDLQRNWEARLEDALPEAPRATAGILVLPAGSLSQLLGEPDVAVDRFSARIEDAWISAGGSRPVCLQVVTGLDPTALDAVRSRSSLGICRWFAHYGAPGSGLTDWLASGAMRAGALDRIPAELPTEPLQRRGYFGSIGPGSARARQRLQEALELSTFVVLGPRVRACLSGDPATCETRVFGDAAWTVGQALQSRIRAALPFAHPDPAQPSVMGGLELLLFASLEREFGPDAFQRFWTASDPPREAFEAAFGVPAGSWLVTWAQPVLGVEPRGPRVPWASLGWWLLAVSLFASAAAWSGSRRTV